MKRVLILGGGFGGIAAALTLRERLAADDEIILADRRSHFMVGFRKSWALVGDAKLEDGQGSLANLAGRGIQVHAGNITAIDPSARAAEVDGRRIEADALVMALGAHLAPEAVPGFSEHAYNVYDAHDIPRAAEALKDFQGGKLVIGIFGAPYKCPPAPYEMALLIQDMLNRRGVKTGIEVFTPQPMSLPVLGRANCDLIEGRLADAGVTFLPNHKATKIEAERVMFTTGPRPYDLLLGVPPHRAPDVVKSSGLTDGGDWVKVDERTMETRFPGVYAVGDVTEITLANGKPLPKAGVFAEAQGRVAAERIAAQLHGKTPQAVFDGQGGCYLEVGGGQAMMVQGNFLAAPEPQVSVDGPSAAYLEEKRAFEVEHLNNWFS